jgi:16S rRNA (guanine(527)-N(7))-methyltransferase RsmG
MPKPGKSDLARRMKEGGIALDDTQVSRLWRYHEMLRDANEVLNVTRIRAFDAMVEKHYIDSLLPAMMMPLVGPVMDLGSGGGLPGIPLAIRYPEIQFKLVEGRKARTAFLETVVEKLGLRNVEVISRKLNPTDTIAVSTVITRAFSDVNDILERVQRSVSSDGSVIMLKGPNCDDEITVATKRFPGWHCDRDEAYALPFSSDPRRLVVYRRRVNRVTVATTTSLQSADNARFKDWCKLHTGKGVRKEGLALLAGSRYIGELAEVRPADIVTLVAVEEREFGLVPESVERVLVTRELMRTLDSVSGVGPVAVVKAPAPPVWSGQLAPDAVTLFLPAQNPENVGAILRTAEALGVRDVVLLAESASPFLPKTLRAAGPAPWRLNLFEGPAIGELRANGITLAALDLAGKSLDDFAMAAPRTLGLVVGMEGPGTRELSPEIPRVTIPLAAGVDSLNASVATGIALYVLRRP